MDYEIIRSKLIESQKVAIRIADVISCLEAGKVSGVPLTSGQITALEGLAKDEAQNLKGLAQDVKQLVT